MVKTIVFVIIRLHHYMVKTIVFVIILIIRLHHYHGEDYCFCHYYYSFFLCT